MSRPLESGNRERFLGRLRDALAHDAAPNQAHPLPEASGIPASVRYTDAIGDLVDTFSRAATDVGVIVQRCPQGDVRDVVRLALERAGPGAVALSRDPEVDAAIAILAQEGRAVIRPKNAQESAAACLGITGAVAALARTGSIVVDAGRAGSRMVSVVTPVHLALVQAEALLPDHGALLRGLDSQCMPSNLVIITGPSRSADIELELTLGVHGPGVLVVGILTD